LNTVQDHLPGLNDYCIRGMMRKKAEKVRAWHKENYNTR